MAAPEAFNVFAMREPRRIKVLCVTLDFIASLASWRRFRVESGVPQDAKLVGCALDELKQELTLAYEHESFPLNDVPGAMFERVRPMVRTYRADGDPPR